MNKRRLYVIGGVIMLIWAFWIIFNELGRDNLEIVFFDVDQGDSIFIALPAGRQKMLSEYQVLIDGGPSSVVLEGLGKEMPFYDRTIELIILTHPDHDHLFGLLEVLKNYQVKNILWTGVVKDTAEYQEWIKLIKEERANIIITEAGQKILLQKTHDRENFTTGVYLEVLNPPESLEGQEAKEANDTSVVVKLVFEKAKILLTGDISQKIEKQLAESYDLK